MEGNGKLARNKIRQMPGINTARSKTHPTENFGEMWPVVLLCANRIASLVGIPLVFPCKYKSCRSRGEEQFQLLSACSLVPRPNALKPARRAHGRRGAEIREVSVQHVCVVCPVTQCTFPDQSHASKMAQHIVTEGAVVTHLWTSA